MKREISVRENFSKTPGARYYTDGKFSGEAFRKEVLEPFFVECPDGYLHVNLDGTYGYATSFLEEAFGGLARKLSAEFCLSHLSFTSDEEPHLIDEIKGYITNVKA